MGHVHHRVFSRSYTILEGILLSSRYGFNRSDLSILDLSATRGPLAAELERKGYRVQRLDQSNPVDEPFDLIICCDMVKEGIHLSELLQTLQPTFQLVLINVPNVSFRLSNSHPLNPAEFGKFRRYTIHKWYDFIYGYQTFLRLRECPMVKIRPIQVDFRLRE